MPNGPRGAPSFNQSSPPWQRMAQSFTPGGIGGFFTKMLEGNGTKPGQPMPQVTQPQAPQPTSIDPNMISKTSGMDSMLNSVFKGAGGTGVGVTGDANSTMNSPTPNIFNKQASSYAGWQ